MRRFLLGMALLLGVLAASTTIDAPAATGFSSPSLGGTLVGACPFMNGTHVGYGGQTAVTCFVPPPPPPSCAGLPTLVPGTEYSVTFKPFSCSVSPWNLLISGSPTVASYSATLIANTWQGGNSCFQGLCTVQAGGQADGNVYYATASDPQVRVVCNQFCPSGSEVAPATIRIPTVAVGASGCNATGFPDATLQVWQPDGSDIEFGYVDTCGSGTNGNWQNNDTISAAAGNCGKVTDQTAIGFFQTGAVASASGRCFAAGMLRANEILSGTFSHALALTPVCIGAPAGSTTQYPALPGFVAGPVACTSGTTFGPPLGARLHYKPTCATINALQLTITERYILCDLHLFGAYVTDDVNGAAVANGFGEFSTEGAQMFITYGLTPPYASLPDWITYRNPADPPGVNRYTLTSHNDGAGQWNPFLGHIGAGPTDPLDPLAQFEWLDPCSAHGTC